MGKRNYKKVDGTDKRSQRHYRVGIKQRGKESPFREQPQKLCLLKGEHVKQQQLLCACSYFGKVLSEILQKKIDIHIYEGEYKNIIGDMHLERSEELPQLKGFGVYFHWEAATEQIFYLGKTGGPLIHEILQGFGGSKRGLLELGDFSASRLFKKNAVANDVILNEAFDITLLVINAEEISCDTKESVLLASLLELFLFEAVQLIQNDMVGVERELVELNGVKTQLGTILDNPACEILLKDKVTNEEFSSKFNDAVTSFYHEARMAS